MTDWKEQLRKRDQQKHREMLARKRRAAREAVDSPVYDERHRPGDLTARDMVASLDMGVTLLGQSLPPGYADALNAWLPDHPGVTAEMIIKDLRIRPAEHEGQLAMAVPLYCQADPAIRWGWRLRALGDGWDDPTRPGERVMVRDIRFDHVDDPHGVLSPAAAAVFGDDAAGAADATIDETTTRPTA